MIYICLKCMHAGTNETVYGGAGMRRTMVTVTKVA